MKLLILEDEIPAYKKLVNCLVTFYEVQVNHDWARTLVDAKKFIEANSYDFILSDIRLLDGISFDLFDAIKIDTPIIFCSAHDEYLFKAFNTNGIAYILKPYTQEEFNNAITKYKTLFQQGSYEAFNQNLIPVLKSALELEVSNYKTRFVIKKTKGIHLLNTVDIALIQASGDFCVATDLEGKKHHISKILSTILVDLNPKQFFKINRSEIVNINAIKMIEKHFKNRLLISLNGYKEKVITSSSTTADFRKWLEG